MKHKLYTDWSIIWIITVYVLRVMILLFIIYLLSSTQAFCVMSWKHGVISYSFPVEFVQPIANCSLKILSGQTNSTVSSNKSGCLRCIIWYYNLLWVALMATLSSLAPVWRQSWHNDNSHSCIPVICSYHSGSHHWCWAERIVVPRASVHVSMKDVGKIGAYHTAAKHNWEPYV